MVNIYLIIVGQMHLKMLVDNITQNLLSAIPFTPCNWTKIFIRDDHLDKDKIFELIVNTITKSCNR